MLNDIDVVPTATPWPPIEPRFEAMPQRTVNYVDHTMNQLQQVHY